MLVTPRPKSIEQRSINVKLAQLLMNRRYFITGTGQPKGCWDGDIWDNGFNIYTYDAEKNKWSEFNAN